MNTKNEFSPGVVRRFLKAAALTLAVGANPNLAVADEADLGEPPADNLQDWSASRSQAGRFPLGIRPMPGPLGEATPDKIRVRVLDPQGRCPIDATVSGPCRLGPLPPGNYLVLYKAQGRLDWQRLSLPGPAPHHEILVRGVTHIGHPDILGPV